VSDGASLIKVKLPTFKIKLEVSRDESGNRHTSITELDFSTLDIEMGNFIIDKVTPYIIPLLQKGLNIAKDLSVV